MNKIVKDVINFTRFMGQRGESYYDSVYNYSQAYIIYVYTDDTCEIIFKYNVNETSVNTGVLMRKLKYEKCTKEDLNNILFDPERKIIKSRSEQNAMVEKMMGTMKKKRKR